MSDILADVSQASMVHAIEANLFAFFQRLSGVPRIEVHDEDHCCWTLSDLPYPLFNSVLRARIDHRRIDAVIAQRICACRERRVPMLWWTGPSTEPADLGEHLLQAGFLLEPAFGMAVELDRATTAAAGDARVVIDRVGDRATLTRWSRVLCDAFGAPPSFGIAFTDLAEAIGLDDASPFRHHLASVGGEPVGTCSLFYGAGVAGIYDVSTLPAWRRRGIGAALTQRAMADARADGYRLAILHASTLGARMYRSLGFEQLCDIGQYVWVPEGFSRT
jgi:GNAT superfamily N-acetyltransferase